MLYSIKMDRTNIKSIFFFKKKNSDEIPINNSIKGNDLYSRDQNILLGGGGKRL
jgi:hypothetical protein